MLRIEIPISFCHISIQRHRIRPRHDCLFQRHILKIPARWPVPQKNPIAIHNRERRQHEPRQVRQALMNLLMQPISLAAQNSVPVLHPQRCAGQLVMLRNRQIENLVGLKKRREYRPAFQHHPAQFHLAKQLRIRQNNLGILSPRRRFDPRPMKAPPRLVAAHIRHDYALCARLPTLPHHLGHEFRIRIGRLLRCAVPRDVRLDHHNVLTADKAPHTTKILQRLLRQRARFSALDNGKVWPLLVARYTMIPTRPLRLRRYRAKTSLAEPHAGTCCSCRDSANPQQLQHGFPPRQRRRTCRAFVVFGHRHPPVQTSTTLIRPGSLTPKACVESAAVAMYRGGRPAASSVFSPISARFFSRIPQAV